MLAPVNAQRAGTQLAAIQDIVNEVGEVARRIGDELQAFSLLLAHLAADPIRKDRREPLDHGERCSEVVSDIVAAPVSGVGHLRGTLVVSFHLVLVGLQTKDASETCNHVFRDNRLVQQINRSEFERPALQINVSRIGENDDGFNGTGSCAVPADSNTGLEFDTCLVGVLAAGLYTATLMQHDNFANGPNLSAGFVRAGDPTFTGLLGDCSNGQFCDVSFVEPFNNRANTWAFDVLNVENAVPEPSTALLLASGLTALAGCRLQRLRLTGWKSRH